MNYYTEYERLTQLRFAAFDACTHSPRNLFIGTDGDRHSACIKCWDATRELDRATRAEYRRARRLQLAAMPRCTMDGCKRRGTVSTFDVLLCGAHFKRVERAHNRASSSGVGLFISPTYKPDDIRRMAEGSAV